MNWQWGPLLPVLGSCIVVILAQKTGILHEGPRKWSPPCNLQYQGFSEQTFIKIRKSHYCKHHPQSCCAAQNALPILWPSKSTITRRNREQCGIPTVVHYKQYHVDIHLYSEIDCPVLQTKGHT